MSLFKALERVSSKGMNLMRLLSLVTVLVHRLSSMDCPVLKLEMRVRQRGKRPFIVMSLYVAVLMIIVAGVFYYSSQRLIGCSVADTAAMGRALLATLSFAQLGMISIVIPAYSAGTVSGERERGALDLLALTTLESSTIIVQKLLAAIFDALMLVLASIPVMAMVFILGGVSPLEVVEVYGLLIVTTVLIGALGVLCSCFFRNSRASILASYLIVGIYLAGIPIALFWLEGIATVGLSGSASSAPLLFTIMFAIVGGIISSIAYGVLALIVRNRVKLWRTRAFRMGIFGGAYILLVFILSTPSILGVLLGQLGFGHGTPLPLYVNPFYAMSLIVQDGGFSGSGDELARVVTATVLFAVGGLCLFQRLAVLKFNSLRRS